jgi:cytochrome c oxidase subunit 4
LLRATAYFVAFGPHGPRRPPPPDEGRKVLFITLGCIFTAFAVFGTTRMFASPIRPRTMTKEWQEASEEYLKSQGSEPITGYKGMLVQSPSVKDIPAEHFAKEE